MERYTKKKQDGSYVVINGEFHNVGKHINKFGKLEDIEERLSKYKEIGINGLIDLFENLTDEDIEYIIQLAFKKRKIIYDIR